MGSVPLEFQRRPSTDLIYNGNQITDNEALGLHNQGIDLSTLNPRESDIWEDKDIALSSRDDQFYYNPNEGFRYISNLDSRLDNFRFNIKQRLPGGGEKFYTVLISKYTHTFLLRKNLLRKLGYNVPKMQYLTEIKLDFNGNFSKDAFIDDLSTQIGRAPEKWITENNDKSLKLQDVILLEMNSNIYNLAMGTIPSQIIQNRRVLNSLLIPYSFIDLKESLNGFSWDLGRIFNNQVLLSGSGTDQFATTYHDALWVLKRLRDLTREEISEIVRYSYFPQEVAALLIEKLISRRNAILEKFEVSHEDIHVYEDITYGDGLENGRLTRSNWPGHSTNFADSPAESPLSSRNIRALFRSQLFSRSLNYVVQSLNEALDISTSIENEVYDRQFDAAREQFRNFLETGQMSEVPFGLYTFPTFNGYAGVSRDIFAGSYLGTNNMIQLADTLTVSADVGLFTGALGLPEELFAGLRGQVGISRSYTHIKPIRSIHAALNEPFRNVFVNLLKDSHGKIFDDIANISFNELGPNDKDEALQSSIRELFDNLKSGESFVITDNLSGTIGAFAQYGLAANIDLQASINQSKVGLRRLHILRYDSDTIHIYKDKGHLNFTSLQLGLDAFIPIVSLRFNRLSGDGETKFYSLDFNLQTRPDSNELLNRDELIENTRALRPILIDNDFVLLEQNQTPYTITHNFNERSREVDFLMFRSLKLKQNDLINVTHPEGYRKQFFRHTNGRRTGVDYQGLTVDIINSLIEESFDTDYVINTPSSGDSGDTMRGRSNTRKATIDFEINQNGFLEPYLNINYRWKGWKIDRRKIDNIINEIHAKFGNILFPEQLLIGTEFLELYAFDINLNLYEDAIIKLLDLGNNQLESFMENNAIYPELRRRSRESERDYNQRRTRSRSRLIRQMQTYKSRARIAYNDGGYEQFAINMVHYITALESFLSSEELIQLLDGTDDIYITGYISGFRGPTENGDQVLISNSIGEYGNNNIRGSLARIRDQIGLSESEFYAFWILRRL